MKIHDITNPRDALEFIIRACNQSSQYTRRTQTIHEAAMFGLGMTQPQRNRRHEAIFARIGDNPGRDAFLKRQAKRDEFLAISEEQEAA